MDNNQPTNQYQQPGVQQAQPAQQPVGGMVTPIAPSSLMQDQDVIRAAHDLGISDQSVGMIQNQINHLPPEANDVDLIEKEWVHHLEQVVAQTAHDPFRQQSEITKVKADYMKKRYNKTMKMPEA